jgi:hypothetical protein
MTIAGSTHCINLAIDIFVSDFAVQLTVDIFIHGNESVYGGQWGHGAILVAGMTQV